MLFYLNSKKTDVLLTLTLNRKSLYPKNSVIDVVVKVNPFLANVPILYPLKTPENQRYKIRGYKMETLARNGLIETLLLSS